MKSKLAMWSWIVLLIGLVLSFITLSLAGENLGLITIIATTYYLGSVLGLIFGVIALKKISKNPSLTRKGHAIIGIVLSTILIIIPLANIIGLGELLLD